MGYVTALSFSSLPLIAWSCPPLVLAADYRDQRGLILDAETALRKRRISTLGPYHLHATQ